MDVPIGALKKVENLLPAPKLNPGVGEHGVGRIEPGYQFLETPFVVGAEIGVPIGLIDGPGYRPSPRAQKIQNPERTPFTAAPKSPY